MHTDGLNYIKVLRTGGVEHREGCLIVHALSNHSYCSHMFEHWRLGYQGAIGWGTGGWLYSTLMVHSPVYYIIYTWGWAINPIMG